MLHIITDGAADLPAEWQETYQIHVVPINIQFDNQTFLQGVDIDDESFYRRIEESGVIPKTSQPSPAQFKAFYEKIARPGDTILSIHVGSKLSGTMDSAIAAARELRDKIHVVPFDSMAGSAAIGWMCREARLLSRRGASLEAILSRLEVSRRKLQVVLALDSLKYARMSGRVNLMQAALASMLRVKPIIMLQDGMLNTVDKARTHTAALQKILSMAEERLGNTRVNLSVVHARNTQAAAKLLDEARQRFNLAAANVLDLSISVAVHLGPGTVGIVLYPDS